jgi:hypothetical protein
MVEADLERAEERAESGESYVFRALFCVLHVSFTDCINEYIWLAISGVIILTYFYAEVLLCVMSFVLGVWLMFTAVVVNVARFLISGCCFQETGDAVIVLQ